MSPGSCCFCSLCGRLRARFRNCAIRSRFGLAIVCALLLFASVVVHEFAHALVARRFGVQTRGITLFIFGGVATLESEPPTARAEAAIAIAGPLMSGLVALACYGMTLTHRSLWLRTDRGRSEHHVRVHRRRKCGAGRLQSRPRISDGRRPRTARAHLDAHARSTCCDNCRSTRRSDDCALPRRRIARDAGFDARVAVRVVRDACGIHCLVWVDTSEGSTNHRRMTAETRDYRNTLNLPKTAFPMKAELTKREPARVAVVGRAPHVREAARAQ